MNAKFDFLFINEWRRRELSGLLMSWHSFFSVYTLSSSGTISYAYESPHFQCKEIWTSYSTRPVESTSYTQFLKQYYLSLEKDGWKTISGKPFTPNLYKVSSNPHGKSLMELEDILRQMLMLAENARFLDERDKKFFISLATFKQGWSDMTDTSEELLNDGIAVVKEFLNMVVKFKDSYPNNTK